MWYLGYFHSCVLSIDLHVTKQELVPPVMVMDASDGSS